MRACVSKLIAERAILYYREHEAIKQLADEVEAEAQSGSVSQAKSERVLALLRKGGARTSLDIF